MAFHGRYVPHALPLPPDTLRLVDHRRIGRTCNRSLVRIARPISAQQLLFRFCTRQLRPWTAAHSARTRLRPSFGCPPGRRPGHLLRTSLPIRMRTRSGSRPDTFPGTRSTAPVTGSHAAPPHGAQPSAAVIKVKQLGIPPIHERSPAAGSNQSINQLGVDLCNLFSLHSGSSLIAASTAFFSGRLAGTPGRIRTCDPLLRRSHRHRGMTPTYISVAARSCIGLH